MFSFNFGLFAPRSTAAAAAVSEEPLVLSPESRVISISKASDDFVEVDLKQLSYAEVAALSRSAKITSYDRARDIKVIDETDLGADVSDVQMATTLSKSAASAQGALQASAAAAPATNTKLDRAIVDALEEDEQILDTLYNDKGNRFPVKKHKKKVTQKKARRSS